MGWRLSKKRAVVYISIQGKSLKTAKDFILLTLALIHSKCATDSWTHQTFSVCLFAAIFNGTTPNLFKVLLFEEFIIKIWRAKDQNAEVHRCDYSLSYNLAGSLLSKAAVPVPGYLHVNSIYFIQTCVYNGAWLQPKDMHNLNLNCWCHNCNTFNWKEMALT